MKLYPFTTKPVSTKPSSIPWNIAQTNAPAFWKFAEGVSPVIAIIDTGIDMEHPEFAGRIFMPKSFDGQPMGDSVGHGTHVAGIIAGKTMGMMPTARIMPLKVEFGPNVNMQIWEAFIYILDWNRTAPDADKVVAVNCSWDGPADPFVNYYVRALTEIGVSVIAAAGNRGDGDPSTHECFGYPAYLWEVITTAALNKDGTSARFSSSFDGVDISAPGVNIISAAPGGDFVSMSGTSMATPHVVGGVALLFAAFRKKYGRWPSIEELEATLWKCIKPLTTDSRIVGRGALYLPSEISASVKKSTDVAPFIKDGRVMTPFRFMGESFDAQVDWKDPNVTAKIGNKKVTMAVNSKDYYIEDNLF